MSKVIRFPILRKKIYGYEITISGKKPSIILENIGFLLIEMIVKIMGFEYMIEPIEKLWKDHDSFKVGEG